MTRFKKIEHDAFSTMRHRQFLLEQPPEFFRQFFGGRIPTLAEKAMCIEQAVQSSMCFHTYENDVYRVEIRSQAPFLHLCIRRHDGANRTNWREFQQIKNELVGPEHEAIELFPAESRLVDTANEYHLWVHSAPDFRFAVGFGDRVVMPPQPGFQHLQTA